jgi:hypothetical protein
MTFQPLRIVSTLLASLAVMLLSACQTVSTAPVGDFHPGTGYQVTLSHAWNDISNIMNERSKKVTLLSMDGPLLNRLYLTDGLVPGDFMIKPVSKEKPTPTYRKDMSASELVEFVSDSISAMAYQRVETSNLRPAKFGGDTAYRFDFTAKTADGLDMSGTAYLAQNQGKLYVLIYVAPTEHYFADLKGDVEEIISSLKPMGGLIAASKAAPSKP